MHTQNTVVSTMTSALGAVARLAAARRRRVAVTALAAATVAGAAVPLSVGAAAPASPHHSVIGPLARFAMSEAAHGRQVPKSRAIGRQGPHGIAYGILVRGSVTAAEIASTGAQPGTVLPSGATAYGTLNEIKGLAQLDGVSEVDLAGVVSTKLDQSVPLTHAAEPGHANTATLPHLWSGTLPHAASASGATLVWHHNSSCEGGGGSTPVLYNGHLYVRDSNSGNLELDASTGASVGSWITGGAWPPAFDGSSGFAVVNTAFNTPHTLTAFATSNNAAQWTYQGDGTAGGDPSTPATVANGMVYVGSTSGNVYAIPEAGNGNPTTPVWSGNAGFSIDGYGDGFDIGPTAMAVGDSMLVVPTTTHVVAFSNQVPPVSTSTEQAVALQDDPAHTGAQPSSSLATPLSVKWTSAALGDHTSYPVIANGLVYVAYLTSSTTTASLIALHASDGSTAWGPVSLGSSVRAMPAYDGGKVFVVNQTGGSTLQGIMRAYDATTGSLLWTTILPGQFQFTSGPTALNGVVYTGGAGSGGTLYAVNETTGAVQWTGSVMNGDESSPAVSSTGVYVNYACDQAYDFSPGSGTTIGSGFTGDTGKSVVVGAVDTGIDIQDPDFRTSTATRIASLWDQAASGSTLSSPGSYGYGRECTATNIDASNGGSGTGCGPFLYAAGTDCMTPVGTPGTSGSMSLTEQDCFGHGTHVAGIEAGNGRASGLQLGSYAADGVSAGTYIGMAPESDIVAVKTDGDAAHIIDGVHYIFQKADALGEPAVVNLSLGVNEGPHDGTSTFDTLLDSLTGPGHLVAAAAGNQATGGFGVSAYYHASGLLGQGAIMSQNLAIGSGPVFIDIWYPGSDRFSVAVSGPGLSLPYTAPDRSAEGVGYDGVCDSAASANATNAVQSASGDVAEVLSCTTMPGSGDNEIQVVLFNPNSSDFSLSGCSISSFCVDKWSVGLRGDSVANGTWHAWMADQSDYFFHGGHGNDADTVSSPGTAHDVVTVGSYVSRTTWPSLTSNTTACPSHICHDSDTNAAVGKLSTFSSRGPTRDGRYGVDVVAPGEMVGSSLSAHASADIINGCAVDSNGSSVANACISPDGAHVFIQGTSMAAPHVAGGLGLLLAQQSSLTPAQAKHILAGTALHDSFTGTAPNVSSGNGKLLLGPGAYSITPSHLPLAGGSVTLCGVDFQAGMTASGQLIGSGSATPLTLSPTGDTHCLSTTMPATTTPGIVPLSFTNPDNSTGTDSITYDPAPSSYRSVSPFRVLDTRLSTRTGTCSSGGTTVTCATLTTGQAMDVVVTGVGGSNVPASGVSAVVMNVTALPTLDGFLTVYPTGSARPLASNLNYVPGRAVPNLVEVPVGTGGKVTVFNSHGSTDVLVDIAGYVLDGDTGPMGLFNGVVPFRLLDTRSSSRTGSCFATGSTSATTCTTLGQGSTLDLQVTGRTGSNIPANGVMAVALNVTSTNPTTTSYLTVYPAGTTRPTASNLNFVAGQVVPNRVIVTVGFVNGVGRITIFNHAGSVDVVVDANGWFTDGVAQTTGGLYSGVTPSRILDTRFSRVVGYHQTVTLQVAGQGGIPAMNASTPPTSVVVNVTATDTTAPSFLTVYPSDVSRPFSSDLNWVGGNVVANLVVVKLSASGAITIYNNNGLTDVIVDVQGWYT